MNLSKREDFAKSVIFMRGSFPCSISWQTWRQKRSKNIALHMKRQGSTFKLAQGNWAVSDRIHNELECQKTSSFCFNTLLSKKSANLNLSPKSFDSSWKSSVRYQELAALKAHNWAAQWNKLPNIDRNDEHQVSSLTGKQSTWDCTLGRANIRVSGGKRG